MKVLLIATALLLAFVGSSLAEDPRVDCAMWGVWSNEQKTMFLLGYSESVDMLRGPVGVLTAIERHFAGQLLEDVIKVLKSMVDKMWPQGYNLGKLGDELDKLCPTPDFKKMPVNLAISVVALRVRRPN